MAKEGKDNKNKKREESDAERPWSADRFAQDAERFKALGDATRLAVISFLMARECQPKILIEDADEEDDGATVTEIACALTGKSGKEPSTLSHHLKELRHAGLVVQTRHGKNICYRAEVEAVSALCERLHCQQNREEPAETAET